MASPKAKPAPGDSMGMDIMHSPKRLALFVAGSILFIFATQIPGGWIEPLERHTAFMVVRLLDLGGFYPFSSGTVITLDDFTVRVIGECTSLYIVFLFCFFVLLAPAGKKEKLLGLMVGIPLLDGLNSLRIAASVIVGAYRNAWFHFFHTYLTQVFSIAIVLLAVFIWLRYVNRAPAPFWGFVGRFALLATLFSFLWIPLNRPFVFFLDSLISQVFKLWEMDLRFTHHHQIYFQTFNLPVFFALILASLNCPMKRRLCMLALGTGVLFFVHLLIRLQNVFMGVFHWDIMALANGFCLVVQYLLPLVLWGLTLRCSLLFHRKPDSLA